MPSILFEEIKNNKIKFFKTLLICFLFFSNGYIESIYGSTLIDLQAFLGISFKVMSIFITVRSFGFFIGAIVGGFIPKESNKEIYILISSFVKAIAPGILPYCKSIWTFLVNAFITGFGLGFIEISEYFF
ncbi:sodium-dependent glucose transporter 1A-like protein [Dinothrombium tinctorium]|uniref:Sodium-dependent glucose transporter 1A-like protein n=1 Tax=Dinothrombium tinctorium TaxID=1965070 RepID=A0A3S3PZE4_9ACAR|nr:sodium-dependent glucose transporter 1A-like protein [Dinothrombium tinctorium]